jgi:Tfp pilus assembly protein PilO
VEEQLRNLTFGKAVAISLVLAAVYYFSVYDDGSGLQNQIKAAREELNKNTTEIAKIKTAMADAERYQQTMAQLGAEMEKITKAVPAQLSSFDLMKIVSNEAKTLGVQINSLRAKEAFRATENKDAIFEPVGVDIELTGTYNQVMEFMSSLTRLDKIVSIKSFNLSSRIDSGRKGDPSPTMNFKAELSGYRYLESKDEAEKNKAATNTEKKGDS